MRRLFGFIQQPVYLRRRLRHLRFARGNLRHRGIVVRLGQIELLLAHHPFFGQPGRALIIGFGLLQRRFQDQPVLLDRILEARK